MSWGPAAFAGPQIMQRRGGGQGRSHQKTALVVLCEMEPNNPLLGQHLCLAPTTSEFSSFPIPRIIEGVAIRIWEKRLRVYVW